MRESPDTPNINRDDVPSVQASIRFAEDGDKALVKGELQNFGQLLRLEMIEKDAENFISTREDNLLSRVNCHLLCYVEGTKCRLNSVYIRYIEQWEVLEIKLHDMFEEEQTNQYTIMVPVMKLFKQMEHEGISWTTFEEELYQYRHRSFIISKILPQYIKQYLEVQDIHQKDAQSMKDYSCFKNHTHENSVSQDHDLSSPKEVTSETPSLVAPNDPLDISHDVLHRIPHLVNIQGRSFLKCRKEIGLSSM